MFICRVCKRELEKAFRTLERFCKCGLKLPEELIQLLPKLDQRRHSMTGPTVIWRQWNGGSTASSAISYYRAAEAFSVSATATWTTWNSQKLSYACCNPDENLVQRTTAPDSMVRMYDQIYVWKHWIDSTDQTYSDTYTQQTGDYLWQAWNDIRVYAPVTLEESREDQARFRTGLEEERVKAAAREERARVEREHQATEYKKMEEKRDAAEAKAKLLLLDLIGEKELATYSRTGKLLVKGRNFDYIVAKEGFVKRVEKNKIVDFCVHLEERSKYPNTDNVIALKLAIENDEQEIIQKLANRHREIAVPPEFVLPECACMGERRYH